MSTANAAAGKIGQSLYFKRSPAQYIVLASSTLLEYNAPFSYSVWVNPADIPSGNGADCMHYYPVTSADAMGWGWDLTVGAPFAAVYNKFEVARYRASDATWEGVTSNGTYVANRWYHLVATFSPTKTDLYINGVLDNSGAATEAVIYYTHNGAHIGTENCGATLETFNGKMDDIRIYNRVLSASEVSQLYKMGQNTVGHSNVFLSNGLVGYWTFDGGSIDWHTNTVADVSGQGNTGSLVGLSTTTSPTPGKIGQALMFNGSSNYVQTTGTGLNLPVYTVSFWMSATNALSGAITEQPVVKNVGTFSANLSFSWSHTTGSFQKSCAHSVADAYPASAQITATMNANTFHHVHVRWYKLARVFKRRSSGDNRDRNPGYFDRPVLHWNGIPRWTGEFLQRQGGGSPHI
jgi:Concanavalin A-like lectin/glucanases superfamily